MRKLFSSIAQCRSGSSAVEFAIIAPVLIMALLSLVGYGIYLSAAHSVQQIAADAARTAIAGMNETERQKLVSDFLGRSTMNHALLDKKNFTAAVKQDPSNPNQFTVSVEYDASDLPIFALYSYAVPDAHIRRFSTMRVGGI
jgi:Flp pilus assembly protein TadG